MCLCCVLQANQFQLAFYTAAAAPLQRTLALLGLQLCRPLASSGNGGVAEPPKQATQLGEHHFHLPARILVPEDSTPYVQQRKAVASAPPTPAYLTSPCDADESPDDTLIQALWLIDRPGSDTSSEPVEGLGLGFGRGAERPVAILQCSELEWYQHCPNSLPENCLVLAGAQGEACWHCCRSKLCLYDDLCAEHGAPLSLVDWENLAQDMAVLFEGEADHPCIALCHTTNCRWPCI